MYAAGTDMPSSTTFRDRVATAKMRASEMYDGARQKVVAGARTTDQAVHNYPYYAMAAALGVGVLVGMLISRRSRSDMESY